MVPIGCGLCAFAAFEVYRAFAAKLSQGLGMHALASAARRWVVGISRFGIGARAAVIAAFGVLVLRAAARGSAERREQPSRFTPSPSRPCRSIS
jgi:pantoate kinase